MALWFPLHVGDIQVGSFSARRVKGAAIHPDALVTYAVEICAHGTCWQVDVLHRVGDGEFALVRRALEAAGDLSREVAQ
jgi:hypothetical protein